MSPMTIAPITDMPMHHGKSSVNTSMDARKSVSNVNATITSPATILVCCCHHIASQPTSTATANNAKTVITSKVDVALRMLFQFQLIIVSSTATLTHPAIGTLSTLLVARRFVKLVSVDFT